MKKAILASALALALTASAASAQKAQDVELSFTPEQVTVSGRVVGYGNAEQVNVATQVYVDCANGVGFNMGLSAALFR